MTCSGRCYSWFVAIDQDGNQEISPLELRTYPLSRNIRVRLNESTESALMNDSGKHLFIALVCVQDLNPRF